jgi:hypothetical protein
MRGLGQHTLLGMWVMRDFGQHTLLGIIGSDVGCLQNNIFLKIIVEVSVSVSPPKLLKRISSFKQNHMALPPCFPINLYKRATIRQKLHLPPNRVEDGYVSNGPCGFRLDDGAQWQSQVPW